MPDRKDLEHIMLDAVVDVILRLVHESPTYGLEFGVDRTSAEPRCDSQDSQRRAKLLNE